MRKTAIIGLAVIGILVVIKMANPDDYHPKVSGGLSDAEVVDLTAKVRAEIRRELISSISLRNSNLFFSELGRWWSTRIIDFYIDERGEAVVSTCASSVDQSGGDDFIFCHVSNRWTFDQLGSWTRVDTP